MRIHRDVRVPQTSHPPRMLGKLDAHIHENEAGSQTPVLAARWGRITNRMPRLATSLSLAQKSTKKMTFGAWQQQMPFKSVLARMVLKIIFSFKARWFQLKKIVLHVLVSSVSSTQARGIWEENLSWAQIRVACGYVSGRLSWLLIDAGASRPLWVATFPGQVVVSCRRKLAEH